MNNMILAVCLSVQGEAPDVLEYNIKEEKSSKFFTFFGLALIVVPNPLMLIRAGSLLILLLQSGSVNISLGSSVVFHLVLSYTESTGKLSTPRRAS